MKKFHANIACTLLFKIIFLWPALGQDKEITLSTAHILQIGFISARIEPTTSIITPQGLSFLPYSFHSIQATTLTCTTNANCNDDILCTTDICNAGVCQNIPNNPECSDGNFCNGQEMCNPTLGCVSGTSPCTECQTCNESLAQCINLPNGTSCSGGSTCQNGLCQPLPIELVFLDGENNGSGIHLTWRTASETQNDYFLVQHSTDGVTFRDLAKVPGAGDSQEENRYEYLHENPSPGTNYYRLKQVDFDGGFEYSYIVSVNIEHTQSSIQVYPNPFSDGIQVEMSNENELPVSARLYDGLGRVVWQGQLHEGVQSLEFSGIPAGVFWLETDWGNRVERVHVVKK
jgi:hypothetical protein